MRGIVSNFFPFQRGVTVAIITPTYIRTKAPAVCQESKLFATNRGMVHINNAVSDFRVRRLGPAAGSIFKGEGGPGAENGDSTTAAEMWAVNAQLRPVSKLIRSIEADIQTRGRLARLTFEAIHSRLTKTNSIRRQMKRISDLIKFTISRCGTVGKLQGILSQS